jgi:signal peptidase II
MKRVLIFLLSAFGVFIIDQGLKDIFLTGYEWHSDCISLELHMNRGVAFSMFSSLGDNLKWIQLILVIFLGFLAVKERWLEKYPLFFGILAGGAIGNLYDRFTHGAVVDFVYWHCGFDFAVFNFADVAIDIAIGSILLFEYLEYRRKKA